MREYLYKDANRDWWKLTIEPEERDDDDTDWYYILYKQVGEEYIVFHEGITWWQYDLFPGVERIMRDFMASMFSLACGFIDKERREAQGVEET